MRIRLIQEGAPSRLDTASSWVSKAEALYKGKAQLIVASDSEGIGRALSALEGKPLVALDTEFYGCKIEDESPVNCARIGCAQITASKLDGSDRVTIYVPNWGAHSGTIRFFRNALRDGERLIGHNVKVDLHALANEGIVLDAIKGDTMVLDYLHINGELVSHQLKEACKRYFPHWADEGVASYNKTFQANIPKKNGEPSKRFRTRSVDEVLQTEEGILSMFNYSIKDPEMTLDLYLYLKRQLQDTQWTKTRDYFQYYEWLEKPYTTTLFRIERRGCVINQDKLEQLVVKVDRGVRKATEDFFALCVKEGVPQSVLTNMNLGSPKQVGDLFTKHLGVALPTTDKGAPSTKSEVLEMITEGKASRVARALLAVREVTKLKSTYTDKFVDLVHKYNGKIYTTLSQIGAVTGRLSSSNPNLQNIATNEEYNLRELFECDPEAFGGEPVELGGIDSSQIEVRLTAHFTKEPVLLQAINEKWDIHALTAYRTFPEIRKAMGDIKFSAATLKEVAVQYEKLRKFAKTINFGVIYGLGWQGYARKTGCSEVKARRDIRNYFEGFPELKKGIESYKAYGHKHGYIRTLLGRYLYLRNINGNNRGLVAQDERRAFNYLVQGCLISKDSRISTKHGMVQITELNPKKHLLLQPSGAVTSNYKVHKTGIKEVFEVATTGGISTTTMEHRYFVSDGVFFEFKQLKDLRVGDWVVEQHNFIEGTEAPRVSEGAAELIGTLLGNGSYSEGSGHSVVVAVGKQHLKYVGHVRRLMAAHLQDYVGLTRRYKVTPSGKKTWVWVLYACRGETIRILTEEFGLGRLAAEYKRVPEWVFSQPASIRASVLKGLFSTDGGVTSSGCSFTSSSFGLVKDVHALLSTLGVASRVRKHGSRAFRVLVPRSMFSEFMARVGFANPHKQEEAEHQLADMEGLKRRERMKLPPEVIRKVGAAIVADPSWVGIRSKISHCEYIIRHRLQDGRGSKEACLAALKDCTGFEAAVLADTLSKYHWVKIEAITPMGREETSDIEIFDEDHGYLANGFVQHNSASDLMRMSMVLIDRDEELRSQGAEIILQIHDELLLNVNSKNKSKIKEKVEYYMSKPYTAFGLKSLAIETPADLGFGPNWFVAKHAA